MVKTIKRAILATRVYEPEAGAAAFRLAALVRALENSGYETIVLTTRPASGLKSTRRVRRWPVLRNRSGVVRGYLQYASFDIPLFFRVAFTRRADIVIVEPPPTTGIASRIACWIRQVPYVYFAADISSTAASGIGIHPAIVVILRGLESWVLRGAATVLAVSEGVRAEAMKLGVPEDRVAVVGNGIDTTLFSLAGDTQTPGYPYLVYAGTMSEIQGADIFVEAFACVAREHPTARLKMFGQGMNVQHLKSRADEIARDRVDFPGTIPGEHMASWLRGANAGLASMTPGGSYGYAYATKAFASLSCGSPVIYAGDGVTTELIREGQLGWSVGWDVADVARAMRAALAAPPSSRDRQRYSAWVAKGHSLDRVAATALKAIDRVTTGSA